MTPFEETLLFLQGKGVKILTIDDDTDPHQMARFHNEMNDRYREIFERENPYVLYGAFWFGADVDGMASSKFLYVDLPQDDQQRLTVLKQAQGKFVPVGAWWRLTKCVRAQLFPTAGWVPEGWDWTSQAVVTDMQVLNRRFEHMSRARWN